MKIPQHIAFIMDGNRRWAKRHKLAMLLGHDRGAHQIEPLVEYASNQGVKFVTFWAFSTENWKRTRDEVEVLMEVFRRTFRDPMIERLKKNGVKFGVIGDTSKFPEDIQEDLVRLIEDTKDNKKITATIALNYGGREELLRAVNALMEKQYFSSEERRDESRSNNAAMKQFSSGEESSRQARTINEGKFSEFLYTQDLPDPDFLIRTGGEMRTSGFLPWQTVYTELYFTETLWPDFDRKELQKALDDYARRERRFGR